ncbi:Protein phosphatase methylesterase 1 [Aphelenchoides fujianensis]|nr:Protein phosphatase methylesterase 1 [Aphelenchoides fujianensis]
MAQDFSPLPWDQFFSEKRVLEINEDKFTVYLKGDSGPVFFLLHGGGYSGLTWACLAEELSAKLECMIVAPDLRGHGETTTSADENLSTAQQLEYNIYTRVFADKKPPLIVIGHSMGGALAVHLVHAKLIPNVVAMAVIDVVEGTGDGRSHDDEQRAARSPANLQLGGASDPMSHATRNVRAARVSMPAQIKRIESSGKEVYRWRVNLSKSEEHWVGWFAGLSEKFLQCSPVKILILASADRLDKELLIGQMRGMFQYEVLPKVGHAVHEDSPTRVAEIFVNMISKYKVIFNKPWK